MEVLTLPLTWTILAKRVLLTTWILLEFSGLAKVKEFLNLKYPRHVVKAACSYMAASTRGSEHGSMFGI